MAQILISGLINTGCCYGSGECGCAAGCTGRWIYEPFSGCADPPVVNTIGATSAAEGFLDRAGLEE